jgi:hypothetical protein
MVGVGDDRIIAAIGVREVGSPVVWFGHRRDAHRSLAPQTTRRAQPVRHVGPVDPAAAGDQVPMQCTDSRPLSRRPQCTVSGLSPSPTIGTPAGREAD